jgi:drug/metabolite transporter (DMT)-like permease
MLVASFLFAVMGLMVKGATERLPAGHAMFARSVVGLVLSWWMLKRAAQSPRGSRPALLALRGFLGFAALMCNFHALSLMPLGDATVLFQTHPVWTAIFAAIFLKERLSPRIMVGCVVATGGVVLVARPGWLPGVASDGPHGTTIDPLGPVLACIAAVLSAAAYVTVRALRRSDPPLVVVFWFAVVATPGSLPLVVAEPMIPMGHEWLLLIGVGVMVQIAQLMMTRALHRETAARVAGVGYAQVVFGFGLGAIFLGERPDLVSLAGAALMVLGALIVTWSPVSREGPTNVLDNTETPR